MEIIQRPSPWFSSRDGHNPAGIIVHGDAGSTDEGTLSWLTRKRLNAQASYHYLVGRDGQVYQLVHEGRKAWHAGLSQWPGLSVGNSVNPTTLGVCLANDGTGDEPFRDVQYIVGAKLIEQLMEKYNIPTDLVRGHFEVSPGRKTDPWDHFDWDHLRTNIRFFEGR